MFKQFEEFTLNKHHNNKSGLHFHCSCPIPLSKFKLIRRSPLARDWVKLRSNRAFKRNLEFARARKVI
uniref:Uncharacterized protein n=1 Tax=Rhizophora mucronata TaxID=61149 RepID=A0A2P2NZC6_RHIMU